MEDITKTGPVGLKGMRGLKQSPSASSQYFENLMKMSTSQLSEVYRPSASEDVGVQLAQAGYGDSSYDEAATTMTQIEDLNELRAQEQPWYSKIANGLAKGVVLAGTTFLDGTIGLLMGAGQGIANMVDDNPDTGFWSGLWDNDFSKAMQNFNEGSEKLLPNYYTQEEQNSPWYENIFTANFLGDKFIKNLGFAVGALYSGGVFAKALKATKLPQIIGAVTESTKMPSMVTSAVGSTISAVNEGRIEALNNSKDWFNYHHLQLNDKTKERLDNLGISYTETQDGQLRIDTSTSEGLKESAIYNETLGKLNSDRIKMGNADFLMNSIILTASNYLQFAKFYANGFKTARRTSNIVGRAGEYVSGSTKKGATWAITKGALSEGTEEISQKAASEIAGDYYATDVNNFYKAKTDRAAEQETLDWTKSFAEGINKTVNEGSSWEEFFIGSLTGMLGVPAFRSVRSDDGKLQSPIVLEGGIYNHLKDYQETKAREQEIADYMNSRVQSPEFLNYYQGLIRHNKYQKDMDQAIENNDEFNFKNAEHAQLVSDIIMFDNAGKLEDLITLINTAYDTSDANLQSIVENTTSTTKDGKKVGPFIDSNGKPLYATSEGKKEMINMLTQNKEVMSKTIDDYVKSKNSIDVKIGQQLSDSQLEELSWMKTQLINWSDRATAMSGEVKQVINKVIGNLNSFIRFQDAIRTEESTKHANLTDRYNKADKAIKDAEEAVNTLNTVKNLDDASFAATLAKNPDFVKGLMREVTLLDNTMIEADEKEDVINKLEDIIKLGNASNLYNEKFNEYLSNPDQQVTDHKTADKKAAQSAQEEANISLRQKLDQATSVAQFREILNSEQDITTRESVLQAMESENSEIAKNYRETLQYNNELNKAINEFGETAQVSQDALALWHEQFNKAENLKQLANPNSIYINNEDAFLEDSEGDANMAENRFQSARYALQRAMSKVNNDIRFKNRFSEEYRKPVDEPVINKGTNKDETGDSGTPTVPHVNPSDAPIETAPTPIGNITPEMVASENSDANKRVETPKSFDQGLQGQRRYYRPAIPELHIEASKEGDFRPFDVVVNERESNVDFSGIYGYLKEKGAFNYVNAAKLKPGDTLGFMIDPEDFNDHTIFIVDTRNNQIVGSIDESDSSISRYEGLNELTKKVRDEYQASKQSDSSTQKFDKFEDTAIITSTSQGFRKVTDSQEWSRNVDDIRNSPDGWGEHNGITYYKRAISGRAGDNTTLWINTNLTDKGKRLIEALFNNSTTVTPVLKQQILDLINRYSEQYEEHTLMASPKYGSERGFFSLEPDYIQRTLEDGTQIYTGEGGGLGITLEILKLAKKAGIIESDLNIIQRPDGGKAISITNYRKIAAELKSKGFKSPRQLAETKIKKAKDERFFATPQVRVSKVMVGRIPYTNEERSLADIPGVLDEDTKPVFGIIKNGTLTTNGKVDDRLIIKPVDMSQKEGRLYLLIPNAAGTYSPAAVRVKHFNNQEFNLDDATIVDTPIGKDINKALNKLADATSQEDVSEAMKELAQDIYMQDIMVTWFDASAGSGIVISKKVRKPDGTYEMVTINGQEQIKEDKYSIYYQSSKKSIIINGMEYFYDAAKESGVDMSLFGQPRDKAEIRKDILNTILKFNLPIQVSVSKINDSGYNNRVIKSNVLTSNLREAKVIGSWFTTDYFDKQGNLQRAVSPSSVNPAPGRRTTTPVGGTEGVMHGTRVSISGTPYIVDLKHNIAMNEKTGEKRAFSAFDSDNLIDMAWAQETFGDATESSQMTDNKIITPKGRVLDRNTGHYLPDAEAQKIKDKITGRNQDTQNRIAKSKIVIDNIYENQKKVDKTRTDNDFYYILEEDGQYHKYSRVHSRLGDNWLGERVETENSKRALEAGTAVDKVIRDFFTSKETPVRPDTLSESAFIDLISKLVEIKSRMEQMGETFMTNNIVLFQKYADGTRIAGEVDILSVDKNGNFKIYDVKTSRYSFGDSSFTEKLSKQRMSTKDYYTLQLSAYQNLFESQYGVRPVKLAILPFVLSYGTTQVTTTDIPSGTKTKLELPIGNSSGVGQGYFRSDKKVDDQDARFVSSEKDGKVYFKPILDTKAHENTLKSTDATKIAVEFIGGDPIEATSLILVEPGEAIRNNDKLQITKKAKVFAVTSSTPYSNTKNVVTSITQEKGIPITYNSAVNVPLVSAVQAPQQQDSLPIFDSTIETMNPENRVLPENAFEEGGEIGYYEKDGKLYTGYLKKAGEIEVTYGSGQKDKVPIHITKIRDIGFGRPGEFGSTSEYIVVFPNGYAITVVKRSDSDKEAFKLIMDALSAKPEKVLSLSNEKTQIHNPRMLEKIETEFRNKQYSSESTQPSGASRTVQIENAINNKSTKRIRHKLRGVDNIRPVWNKEKELTWLKNVLPQLSEQDRIKVVKGLIQVSNNGPVAWGMFSDGIITLSDIAAEGTTYHEAFHVVFNLMMTDSEKENLFNEAREVFGNKSLLELEEDMAEGFREYVASQESRSLSRRILDFFKDLFAKVTNWKYIKPSLTAYYRMINQGRYRNTNLNQLSSNTGEFSTTNDNIRYRVADNTINQMRRETQRFLDNFGITIKEVSEFENGDLFDALNRTINIRNVDDISEGVGYAIAFMMQHNDMMNTLMKYKLQLSPKGVRRSIRNRGDYNAQARLKDLSSEVRQKYLREIGSDIATELRKLYKVESINVEPKSFLGKLWEIITEFFNMLTPTAKTKFDIIKHYTSNIANSIKLNDPSIILTTDYKPGTTEKAIRVNIGQALKENPYERNIIELLNSKNIALAGSASIALDGSLYRPSENPLHDIDFNAIDYSKEELDSLINENFPNNKFIREINDEEGKSTETYLILDRPFESRREIDGIAINALYDKKTGKRLGTWIGSELTLENGVQGKFLDFFIGKNNRMFPNKIHNINGKSYLIADYRNAFNAKITWARPKDIWDYNRFNTESNLRRIEDIRKVQKEELKRKLQNARIIWGHPAIGKTTYLERNQDILEWDQEVNPKRNKFLRDQIDPEHKMDINSKEYKQLRSEYMSEWKSHPEYIEFLTKEWEALKSRAKRENKRLFASPGPLLEIGREDFDLFITLPEKTFLKRNEQRGGTHLGSMGWKQVINDLLVRVDSDKIVTTDKYFSEFMRENLGVQWGTLTEEESEILISKGWTQEKFDSISQKERDHAIECLVL